MGLPLSDSHHDFTQFVSFGPDVVHEHLVRGELVLDWQRVVLTLLHLLQLDSLTQVPHHLDPESGLTEEAEGGDTGKYHNPLDMNAFGQEQSCVLPLSTAL